MDKQVDADRVNACLAEVGMSRVVCELGPDGRVQFRNQVGLPLSLEDYRRMHKALQAAGVRGLNSWEEFARNGGFEPG